MHEPDHRDTAAPAPNPQGKLSVRILAEQEARSRSKIQMALFSFPSNLHLGPESVSVLAHYYFHKMAHVSATYVFYLFKVNKPCF